MKTVTIPFDLEMAKKIQSGEVEGKILDDYKTEYEIIKYDAKGNYRFQLWMTVKKLT